jgi:hypothetical protein
VANNKLKRQMKKYILFFFSWLICCTAIAQTNKNLLDQIDEKVQQMGAMQGSNLANITQTITTPFNGKREHAMAIYCWIGRQIKWNVKSTKSADTKNSLPENVIALRTATPLGFANLYQEMCSQSDIRCLVVDGYVKYQIEQIGEMPEQVNASWNVVQLGSTPSEWFYVDVFNAAGKCDKKWTIFTPDFTKSYFFPEKEIFNGEHYPDNEAWLLSRGPAGLKDFVARPILGRASYENGLVGYFPDKGKFISKLGQPFRCSLRMTNLKADAPVTLLISEGNKPALETRVNLETMSNNDYYIDFRFKKEAEYRFTLQIDGKDLLTYLIEVVE